MPLSRSPTRPTARLFGRPVRPMLAPFPVSFLAAALVTDIAYANSANLFWQYCSIWLLTAGLAIGGLAGVAGLVDWLGARRTRRAHDRVAVLNVVIWAFAFVNALVHSRDGWTAVVPDGLVISAITAALLAIRGFATTPVWTGART